MSKKHYVYKIKNIIDKKYYIGVRSCTIDPINDLGKKYFSSSSDKKFIEEQRTFPERFTYEILEEFDTRKSAMIKEIELHSEFKVSINKDFYNLAEAKYISFGTDSNMITAFNISENKSGLWPKEDFDNNRDNYIFASDGKVIAFNISENKSGLWPKEDFDNNRDNYISPSKNTIIVYDVQGNKFCRVPLDWYKDSPNDYLTPNSNAYKLLKDPDFKELPHHSKDYIRCFDIKTLGVVMFLKTDAKTRDKNRFINANSSRKKTMLIKNKRKLIPTKELPKPIIA